MLPGAEKWKRLRVLLSWRNETQEAVAGVFLSETDEVLDFVSERFRLLPENRSRDMIYQDKFKTRLSVLLLRLKVDRNYIGEVDIRAVRSIFRLDKTYFLHGNLPQL